MAAIRQIMTIHQGETQYYSQFGRYAASLTELGPPASGAVTPAASDLIRKVLANRKTAGTRSRLATPLGYSVTAVPDAFGRSGRRTIYPTRGTGKTDRRTRNHHQPHLSSLLGPGT